MLVGGPKAESRELGSQEKDKQNQLTRVLRLPQNNRPLQGPAH